MNHILNGFIGSGDVLLVINGQSVASCLSHLSQGVGLAGNQIGSEIAQLEAISIAIHLNLDGNSLRLNRGIRNNDIILPRYQFSVLDILVVNSCPNLVIPLKGLRQLSCKIIRYKHITRHTSKRSR